MIEKLKGYAALTGVGIYFIVILAAVLSVYLAYKTGHLIGVQHGRLRFQRDHTESVMQGLTAANVVPLHPTEETTGALADEPETTLLPPTG